MAMIWDYPQPFLMPLMPASEDIDGLNHTNNAVYVKWCEKIGWAHSAALGLELADYRRLNRAMAIRHGEYDYLLPTLLGEPLTLGTWLADTGNKLLMERRFQLLRDKDAVTVLRGRWELICIEITSGRVRRMPTEFECAYRPAMITAGEINK